MILENDQLGFVLSGIIGSGKTTVAEQVCVGLTENGFEVLRFDGDDVQFRNAIRQNSRFFIEEIAQRGLSKPFLFVDEVQKEPEIFDAIKLAYDKKQVSFIVSGSNPGFLRTVAQERLQRRGMRISLHPLTIAELAAHNGLLKTFDFNVFNTLLWESKLPAQTLLKQLKWSAEIEQLTRHFLVQGGLPLAATSKNIKQSLNQIKLTAEHGITDTFSGTIALADEIRRYLAFANSREFTYQGIHQQIRSTKRQVVDSVIDHLLNHGYIFKKRPYLEEYEQSKSTYLAAYSWIDPGIVTYFQGDYQPTDQELGFRLEAYIHTRLVEHLEAIPIQSQIYYHKPFTIKPSIDALSYKPGELDFIVVIGKKIIPIEVKLTAKIRDIDTSRLEEYMRNYQRSFGLVVYGGSPYLDESKNIFYFPYWYL
jgi:predicted AAA+ superfamily ATPase